MAQQIKKTVSDWLISAIYQKISYLIWIYIFFFSNVFWAKLVIGILLPIAFYIEVKQDYYIILKNKYGT